MGLVAPVAVDVESGVCMDVVPQPPRSAANVDAAGSKRVKVRVVRWGILFLGVGWAKRWKRLYSPAGPAVFPLGPTEDERCVK
jgi:hypothetical protein